METIYLTHHPHRTSEALSPDIILAAYRGPGPGGQHRNKTSSTIRATHTPTGLTAIANDSRDQSRNEVLALTRLRHLLTVRCRKRVFLDRLCLPPEFDPDAGPKSAAYLPTLGHTLDTLHAAGYVLSTASKHLGVTTGALSSFLTADNAALAYVNQQRAAVGLRPLRR